jgi:hypothetical protein
MLVDRVLGVVVEKTTTNAIEPRVCLVLRTICANFVKRLVNARRAYNFRHVFGYDYVRASQPGIENE